jgi:hypothetical protein
MLNVLNIKRRAKLALSVAVAAAAMAIGGVETAKADYCSDFGLCEQPRYSVVYNYDWFWSNETLRWYQLRICYWSNGYYVYAVSFC